MNAEDTFNMTREQFQKELDKMKREMEDTQEFINRMKAYDKRKLVRPETRVIKS